MAYRRRVVVVGGTHGIGKSIVQRFARSGDSVLFTGTQESSIKACLESVPSEYLPMIHGMCLNLGSDDCGKTLLTECSDILGGVDVLCLNAGIFPSCPLGELNATEFRRVLNVNLVGGVLCLVELLELLKNSTAGRVIITSSITGPQTGYPGWSHYGASKAGQLGFMRTAALELAPFGITVNAVLPGNVATEGLTEMGEEYLANTASCIPLGRLSTPEEIAHVVEFFSQPESGYITGQALAIDGGQTLPENPDGILPLIKR